MATALLILPGIAAMAQEKPVTNTLFDRTYRNGEKYRYRLRSEQYYNGQWNATSVAVCELTVVQDISGVHYDVVRWVSMRTLSPKDTLDLTKQAALVNPYRISLEAAGKLDLPKITIASMTGPITDLNTFLVAISPKLGSDKLHAASDTFANPKPVTGNFSNGKTTLHGSDCLQTSLQLDKLSVDTALLTTRFLPPAQPCLNYLVPEMKEPVVKDTANNFQMVMPVGKDKFNIQFGREYFVIGSVIRRSDGKLLSAVMNNSLSLQLNLNCDSSYANCQTSFPFLIDRRVMLELIR